MAPFAPSSVLPPRPSLPPPPDQRTVRPSLRPSSALFPLKLRALSVSVAAVVEGGAAVDLKNVQTAQQQSVCKEAPRSEEGPARALARPLPAVFVLFPFSVPCSVAAGLAMQDREDLTLLLAEVHE